MLLDFLLELLGELESMLLDVMHVVWCEGLFSPVELDMFGLLLEFSFFIKLFLFLYKKRFFQFEHLLTDRISIHQLLFLYFSKLSQLYFLSKILSILVNFSLYRSSSIFFLSFNQINLFLFEFIRKLFPSRTRHFLSLDP